MRNILIIISLITLFGVVGLYAQNPDGNNSIQIEGKEYTLHKVAIGETIFSISKKYNIEMTELVAVNKIGESGYAINSGRLLIVPLYARRSTATEEMVQAATADGYITHVVKPGETLYSIAKNYIGITPQLLKQKNNLKSDTVRINQKIVIPQNIKLEALYKTNMAETETGTIEKSPPVKAEVEISTDEDDILKDLMHAYARQDSNSADMEVARGIATWLSSGHENKKTFYALHKYAPIGTIIKVRNLMNNRITYVKVIGKLPENEENKNIVIKLSRSAAKYLNVLDEKFLVELMIPLDKS